MAKTNLKITVLLVLAVAILVTTCRGSTSSCGVGTESHTVADGETCWDLAGGTNEKLAALQKANPAVQCGAGLQVGTAICVPT
ncbi:hypothetical protein LINGRAHAP2_LOCUS36523 [Linum grandiflorum]